MNEKKINQHEWENPDNWSGPDWMAVYFSKKDSRCWVPKKKPWMGWTINLGQICGIYWLIAIVGFLPTIIVAIGVVIYILIK